MNNLIKFIKLSFVGLFFLIPLYFLIQKPKEISELDVYNVVNSWRNENGYSILVEDDVLCDFAEIRLIEIDSDWSHNGFKSKSQQLLLENGYLKVGENLYTGLAKNADAILTMWLNSPTHRNNIIDSYTNTCVQCNEESCVQIFSSY